MTHRKDLIKEGFRSFAHGTKRNMEYIASMSKTHKKIKNYRIVKYKDHYELYVK